MRILIIFSILSVIFPGQSRKHPVHVSVTNIEYSEQAKTGQISIRIFTDDFESAMNKRYETQIHLGKAIESKKANLYILNYIRENFQISSAKSTKPYKLNLTQKTVNPDDNSTSLELEFKADLPDIIIVENTILADLYADQKNLLIFTNSNTQFSHKFSANDRKVEFSTR